MTPCGWMPATGSWCWKGAEKPPSRFRAPLRIRHGSHLLPAPVGCAQRRRKSCDASVHGQHTLDGIDPDALAGAHERDLQVQERHGARYLRYWYSQEAGRVYCLVEAPSKEAAEAVHREAHGLVADEIIPVNEGA